MAFSRFASKFYEKLFFFPLNVTGKCILALQWLSVSIVSSPLAGKF